MRRFRVSSIVAALLLAGGLAGGFLLWRPGGGGGPGPGTAPGGWDLRSGALEPVAEEAGGGGGAPRRFRAAEEARLERGGQGLILSPGSIVEFLTAPGASTAALPAVVEGSASFTSDRPFLFRGLPVTPRGPVTISITAGEATVREGRVVAGGALFGPGGILPYLGARPARPPAGSGPAPGGKAEAPDAEAEEPTGQVIDARNGAALASVEVRATFSYQDDGYPPLDDPSASVVLHTDAGGFFRVPPFRVEDPRLKLHLQADHPDFLPALLVVEDAPDARGRFPFVTLRLRRALTIPLLLLDPAGQPLGGVAVEAVEPAADSLVGEDTWEEGRSFRPDRPSIFYTGEDGILRVPRQFITFTLRHPLYHLVDALPHRGLLDAEDAARLPEPRKSFLLDLRPGSEPRLASEFRPVIRTGLGEPKDYLLQDQRGTALGDCLLEIALEDMPPLRLFTDGSGAFSIAPRPFPRDGTGTALSPEYPRKGTLTTLSPFLWKSTAQVAFPSRASLFRLNGRRGGELRLRVGELDENQGFQPVPAEDLTLTADLTLVRRTTGGEALFAGLIPPAGTRVEILLRGHLPETVSVPPHLPAETRLDFGDLPFRPGGVLAVTLSEGTAALYRRARFLVADRDHPALDQEYRPDAAGRILVGGLIDGHTYFYATDGSGLERSEGEFLVTEKLLREGLTIPLVAFDEAEVILSGEVVGVRPEEVAAWRVIERYFPEREKDPLTTLSYPLPPDGLLGSRRILRRPVRAEVFVIGPSFRMGSAVRGRPPADWTFEMGRILPRESHHAIFTFAVDGLGKVLPPEGLSLFAELNQNHEIARLSRAGRALVLENLLPGDYLLRWGGEEREQESFAFSVRAGDVELSGEILRKAALVETVEFQLTDSAGDPVEGAEIECSPHGLPPVRFGAGGIHAVKIGPRVENHLRIVHRDFLPVRVDLPPGAALPDPLVLLRGTGARAVLKDAAGRPFDGRVVVSSWAAEKPDAAGPAAQAAVAHGEPATYDVARGVLNAGGLPPGKQAVKFQDVSSEAAAVAVFDLGEKRINDLGILTLRETRSIAGLVYLPDGQPAADSLVGLVKPEHALRFPERPVELTRAAWWGRADALGRFRIDGLPLDLREELALVAHRDGFADAVLSPVDLSAREFALVLQHDTVLELDAGYSPGVDPEQYQFRLQYFPDQAADPVELGPLGPGQRGGRVYHGITPGAYRVLWELKEPHPDVEPRSAVAQVAPGVPVRLALRVDDRFIPGEAILNGERLRRGWVLLVDPAQPAGMTIGRVRNGRFVVPVPLRTEDAHASLIPERDPLPAPAFGRGEALPREIPEFRTQLRRKFLTVEYRAHDLTINLPPEMISRNPDLEIEFPHYFPGPGGFRRELAREPIDRTPFHLRLLPEGTFSLRISGRGVTRLFQSLELHQDLTVTVN